MRFFNEEGSPDGSGQVESRVPYFELWNEEVFGSVMDDLLRGGRFIKATLPFYELRTGMSVLLSVCQLRTGMSVLLRSIYQSDPTMV
jgi:hypothetical protein